MQERSLWYKIFEAWVSFPETSKTLSKRISCEFGLPKRYDMAPITGVKRQTLPQTKLFQSSSPLYNDLRDILLAHSVFWRNSTPSYASGISYVAATLLITMPPQDAFLCLVNIVNKSLLKPLYAGSQDEVRPLSVVQESFIELNTMFRLRPIAESLTLFLLTKCRKYVITFVMLQGS